MSENQVTEQKNSKWKTCWLWIRDLVIPVAVIYVLFFHIFGIAVVSGNSMSPTINDGSLIFIHRYGTERVENGDVIVFSLPTYRNNARLVKRVIGTPGDTINIDFNDGVVYRNGEPLEESYVSGPTNLSLGTEFPLEVPDGYVFVLGDNRNESVDSRSTDIGLVPYTRIVGVMFGGQR